jgi:hypothetical protein
MTDQPGGLSEMTDQPHILVITETTEDGVTEHAYEIECPGVTDRCLMWRTCDPNEVIGDLGDADTLEPQIVHGVVHRLIEDMWMVPTEGCFVRDNDFLPEAADSLELRPGRYPVDFGAGDGCDLSLTVLAEAAGLNAASREG